MLGIGEVPVEVLPVEVLREPGDAVRYLLAEAFEALAASAPSLLFTMNAGSWGAGVDMLKRGPEKKQAGRRARHLGCT